MVDTELVKQTLNLVRPALQADGGDIQLVSVEEDGTVKVRLKGACAGCPHAMMELQNGIARVLQDRVPGITNVVPVDYDA